MSNLTDTATIKLVVNGEQATKTLTELETKLAAAKKKLADLKASGADTKSVNRATKEVEKLATTLERTKSRTEGVKKALEGMDSLAPRQLNQALRTLLGQMNGLKQGTREWEAHAEAVRKVKQRIRELNDALKPQESIWQRLISWANRWQIMIVSAIAGTSSLFDALRKSVDAYAEMDQQMADARKFTGMTAEQVDDLNDEFKKFDTRTPREELNKLAQEEAGIPFCPPEGDAGTGMAATNSVAQRTGNVSAGTSVFGMIVLEKDLSKVYDAIDLVTTPDGSLVAMVHCNNCTSDLNAWVNLFKEYSEVMGMKVDMNELYGNLYRKALEGDDDCGGLLAYNYFSGEHVTGFNEGRPMFVRTPDAKFNLANFMRVHLFTSLGALKTGFDILFTEEKVQVDEILGHGGLFKTKGVGQSILAAAMNAPVSVMETAGEGGAWGIALLASYMINKGADESLAAFLDSKVFAGQKGEKMEPKESDVKGFNDFMKLYSAGLAIERAAVDSM